MYLLPWLNVDTPYMIFTDHAQVQYTENEYSG